MLQKVASGSIIYLTKKLYLSLQADILTAKPTNSIMDSKDIDLTNIDARLQELEELAEVIKSLQKDPNHNPEELELLS